LENPFISTPGTYILKADNPNRGVYQLSIVGVAGSGWYTTDNLNTGVLNITRCDLSNRIFSGTFSFTAKNNSTSETVNVTDGRFDLKE